MDNILIFDQIGEGFKNSIGVTGIVLVIFLIVIFFVLTSIARFNLETTMLIFAMVLSIVTFAGSFAGFIPLWVTGVLIIIIAALFVTTIYNTFK